MPKNHKDSHSVVYMYILISSRLQQYMGMPNIFAMSHPTRNGRKLLIAPWVSYKSRNKLQIRQFVALMTQPYLQINESFLAIGVR
jgi:hypothetical protein